MLRIEYPAGGIPQPQPVDGRTFLRVSCERKEVGEDRYPKVPYMRQGGRGRMMDGVNSRLGGKVIYLSVITQLT